MKKNLRSGAGPFLSACLLGIVLMPGTLAADQRIAGRTFDCVIDPTRVVKLGSPVTGILAEVLVNRGDAVRKDQIVARMDQEVERVAVIADRLRAESTAEIDAQTTRNELIEKELERAQTLVVKGASTQQRVDDLTAQLNVGRRELERLHVQKKMAQVALEKSITMLDQRDLRSPVDGIVQQRVLTGGEFVNQQSYIVVIAQLDPLAVETFLPVEHYQAIKMGQTATVTTEGAINGSYSAVVTVVDRIFDAASKTFGVRLELRNPDYSLPAGQVCKVVF